MSSGSEKTVSGNVQTAAEQEAKKKRVAIREQNKVTIAGAIFSRLTRFPIINVWLRKKVETSRDVVKEEKGLFDDLADHHRSFERLLDIDVLVREDKANREAIATAAENKLAAEQRIAAAREKDDAIYAKKEGVRREGARHEERL